MRICKYCRKPILDNEIWNPDREGNGYHHACLNEMEFKSRDKRIYDQGRADVLDKIRAEIDELYSYVEFDEDLKMSFNMVRLEEVQKVIDKYKEDK